MKRWLLSLMLTGCLLEGFDLPAGYRPAHPGAVAPIADRTVLHAPLDPVKGGDVFLRFFGTGPTSYVMEKFTVLPDGETAALPPAHVRFVPLDADHYALYWQIAAVPGQGYAVVRFDADGRAGAACGRGGGDRAGRTVRTGGDEPDHRGLCAGCQRREARARLSRHAGRPPRFARHRIQPPGRPAAAVAHGDARRGRRGIRPLPRGAPRGQRLGDACGQRPRHPRG